MAPLALNGKILRILTGELEQIYVFRESLMLV